MPYTRTKEIERAAVDWCHSYGLWWCEETGRWENSELAWTSRWAKEPQEICRGCRKTLAHPNHSWSRRQQDKQ